MPVDHWAVNRRSSSARARRTSRCAHPIAMKALSQLHWCGYRCGDAFVQLPASLPWSTAAARSRSTALAVTLKADLLLTLGPVAGRLAPRGRGGCVLPLAPTAWLESGRQRPRTEPRSAYALASGIRLSQERRAVKPSARRKATPNSDRTVHTHQSDSAVPANAGTQRPGDRGQTLPGLRPGGWLHSAPAPCLTPSSQRAREARSGTPPLHSTSRNQNQDQMSRSRSKSKPGRWPRHQERVRVKPVRGGDACQTRGLDQRGPRLPRASPDYPVHLALSGCR